MRKFALCVLLSGLTFTGFAQDDLFGLKTENRVNKGLIFGANGNFDIPGGDLAKRFGNNFRIGASISYKTTTNWMFGVKGDFIFGNKMKDDSLMAIYRSSGSNGGFITRNGFRSGATMFERGYMIGIQAGKIINLSKEKSDNGILLMTGVGYIQHKIKIVDQDENLAIFNGDLKKGYDRLTNGIYVEQFVGYNYFDKSGFINFNIGLDFVAGFTAGRRNYQYDIMRSDQGSRFDLLSGIKLTWYIPMFHRRSEDYYFQ